jgi:hypothetical protein
MHTMHGSTRVRARWLYLQVCSNLVNCVLDLTLGVINVFDEYEPWRGPTM